MIFAIVFGLSMDYEMFLLARMHEEWEQTRDAPRAGSRGSRSSADSSAWASGGLAALWLSRQHG